MNLASTHKQQNSSELLISEEEAIHYIKSLIAFIGDNTERKGLANTPKRIIKAWKEIFSGYRQNSENILSTTFENNGYNELVLCKDIEFYSTCEHHFQPIIGIAHIGYIPNQKVVGLSKLARLVECFARRLQIQENLTHQIAYALEEHLEALGVAVLLKARHFCMCARGVNKQNSWMTTNIFLGSLKNNEHLRKEFFELVKI